MIMDNVYKSYGDRDLICGYRMMLTRSSNIQMGLCHLQQRKYLKVLKCVEDSKTAKRQRDNMMDDEGLT